MSLASPALEATASRPGSGVVSPRHVRSRTQSISSDRPSTIGFGLVLPPLLVSPEATFIAPSAASQIITNDHDSHADAWYDQNGIEPARETAIVSGPALQLVNGFLDQLLFNFLQVSRATSLSSLRPAVIEVLKPKLGKDAIANADEELGEYLGSADEGEYPQPQRGPNSPRDWDVELVWKRTRLRCMVYSSLGDMEEEDEDLYMEQENLEIGADEHISDVISPAVAIFLTSVIEYMGELTLTVAGQAAYHRVRSKIERELREGSRDLAETADRIVVTELDMERVALDRTLGRLWRGWKKRMRTPTTDLAGRPFSRGSPSQYRPDPVGHDALGLTGTPSGDVDREAVKPQEHHEEPIAEDVDAVDIPLPLGDRDVDEIEVPGLVHYSDDEDGDDEREGEDMMIAKRPISSFLSSSIIYNGIPAPTTSSSGSPLTLQRQRSSSLPSRRVPHFNSKTLNATNDAMVASGTAKADEGTVELHADAATHSAAGPITNAGAIDVGDVEAADAVASDYEVSSLSSHYSDADEEASYEQAEIVTSSRVSVLSNPSDSDHGSNVSVHRTPSVHSARIIDVPAHSRGSSMESVDGARPRSVSGTASSLARAVVSEDRMKSVNNGSTTRATPTSAPGSGSPTRASPPLSSPDRRKLSTNRASVISERDEETTDQMSIPNTQATTTASRSLTTAATPAPQVTGGQHSQTRTAPNAGKETAAKDVEEPEKRGILSKDSPRGSVAAKARRDKPISAIPATAVAGGAAVTAAVAAAAAAATTSSSSGFAAGTGAGSAALNSADAQRKKHPPVSLTTAPKPPARPYDEAAPTGAASQPVRTPVSPTAAETERFAPDVPRRSPGRPAVRSSPKQPDSRGLASVDRVSKFSDQFDQIVPPPAGQRPQHTSASSVSSGQSRRRPLRTSEDGSSHSDNVARNFEELIQSNQTITYTLTPENMRDIDEKRSLDGPVVTTRQGRKGDESRPHISPRPSPTVGQFPKMPSPRVVQAPPSPIASTHRNGANTAGASGPVPRTPTGLAVSTGRMGGAQARDARVPVESTSDFAEFIRSTGPASGNKSYAVPKTNAPPVSPTATSDKRTANRASTMSNRVRQQPRDAAADSRGDNTDLIDFIRQGPPIATAGHRIPRHVAPFRTTQDSDQMSGAMGGRAVDATIPDIRSSQGSTNATESSMPSMQSSVNSKSALLMGKGHQAGGYNSGHMPVDNDMAMMMPKRKTRRVRDPYAIDFSDEEDLDDEMTDHITEKPRVPAKEESLAEFLKNYDPPPEPVAPPESKAPKRKVSAPSLINRFTRSGKDTREKESGAARTPTSPSFRIQNSASPISPRSPTGGKRHIPIQVNMQSAYDRYGQPLDGSRVGDIDVISSANGDSLSNGRPRVLSSASSGARRVPMKRFEPRDAVNSRSQTAELAAFLRDSAPPPTEVARAPSRQDEGNGISRVFGRRKKMAV